MHWRRKWQPTPVFLPGESQGLGSLVGICLRGRTESDTTEAMQQQQHLWILELDHKEGWMSKNWSFWTVVLKKTLESPLECKEIKPVNPKGNQSWIFIGRTDAETEAPVLWPSDAESRLIGKDPGAGKYWSKRRRGWQRLNNIIDSMGRNLRKLRETVKDREAWNAAVHGFAQSWTRLSDWTVDISPYKYENKTTKHFKEFYRHYHAAHMNSSFILCSKHNSLERKEHETNFLRKMVYPREKKPCNWFLKNKQTKKNLYCLFNN